MTDAKIIQQIKNIVAAMDEQGRREAALAKELESQGFRIIEGGSQINDSNESEPIYDSRTGETISDDAGGKYYHADNLYDDVETAEPEGVKGIPESLIEALREWTYENEEDARSIADAA
jgi:hypothetical protein